MNLDVKILLDNKKSMILGSVDNEANVLTSYAPFLYFEGTIYFIISPVAEHYENVVNNKFQGLLIDDESESVNIFFRKRLTMTMTANIVNDQRVVQAMTDKHGSIILTLLGMKFNIFKCSIGKSSVVTGPGQAFDLDENFVEINQKLGVQIDKILNNCELKLNYKNKNYYLIKKDFDKQLTSHSTASSIEIVYDVNRIEHVTKHLSEDIKIGLPSNFNSSEYVLVIK